MVSFDSTLKANLSVGMPLDLHLYKSGSLGHGQVRRIEADDPYFAQISTGWGEKLREAFDTLPDYALD
jgi:putative proteasome-type protease